MQLIRTTLRIKSSLKKAAERKALEENSSLQRIFNQALENYLNQKAKRKAQKIVFKTHDLGEAVDNLHRDDYYSDIQ